MVVRGSGIENRRASRPRWRLWRRQKKVKILSTIHYSMLHSRMRRYPSRKPRGNHHVSSKEHIIYSNSLLSLLMLKDALQCCAVKAGDSAVRCPKPGVSRYQDLVVRHTPPRLSSLSLVHYSPSLLSDLFRGVKGKAPRRAKQAMPNSTPKTHSTQRKHYKVQ